MSAAGTVCAGVGWHPARALPIVTGNYHHWSGGTAPGT